MLSKATQERFAMHYALNGNAAEAYRQCGAKGKRGRDAGKRGAEYRNKPEIKKRIMELRREIEIEAAGEFAMSKRELLVWLSAVLRMTISQANASSPFVQRFTETRTARRSSTQVVFVDKIRAAWLLATLSGWHRQEAPALPRLPSSDAPVDSSTMAARLAERFAVPSEMGSVPGEKYPRQVPAIASRATRPLRVPLSPLICCQLVAS